MATLLILSTFVQHANKVAGPEKDSSSPAVELLAALLLHHSPLVRRSALTAGIACCKQSPSLGTAILTALQMWLRRGAPPAVLQDPTADDAAPSPSATAQRCRRAVASLAQALTTSGNLPSAAFYARLLQMATHPLVTVGVSYTSFWKLTNRCFSSSHYASSPIASCSIETLIYFALACMPASRL